MPAWLRSASRSRTRPSVARAVTTAPAASTRRARTTCRREARSRAGPTRSRSGNLADGIRTRSRPGRPTTSTIRTRRRSRSPTTRRPDDRLRDGRCQRPHGHRHLVGEPRPDAGRPGLGLLDRPNGGAGSPAPRPRSATRRRTRHGSRSRAPSTTSTRSRSPTRSRAPTRWSATPPRRPATPLSRRRSPTPSITNNTDERRAVDTGARHPCRRARAEHDDADPDRDLQRPRHAGHRQGHLRGLLDEQLLELRSAPSTRAARHSRSTPTAPPQFPAASPSAAAARTTGARRTSTPLPRAPRSARPSPSRSTRHRPTMSSATVAADGVTVTVTWSENLDQTQAVPGSAFSVAPNGGGGIAGTATAVTYPAANQTRFTLASTVHHLDSLALTYTKPGSGPDGPRHRPAHRQPRRHATLTNASITNNTANVAPTTPALVTPDNAAQVNTARRRSPRPSATRTRTTRAPSPSRSARPRLLGRPATRSRHSAPAPVSPTTPTAPPRSRAARTSRRHLLLARRERRQLSATSSLQRDPLVRRRHHRRRRRLGGGRRRRPHGDGHLVGEPRPDPGRPRLRLLDQRDRRAPDRTVTYPAADQTRFTLASAVNHLDTLTLDYTKPGAARRSATPHPDRQRSADDALERRLGHQQHRQHRPDHAGTRLTPAERAALNTATPTLTATFSDPDPNDTGTVTFQVCAVSDCSSSLAHLQLDQPAIANDTNGTAAVPGGTITTDGTYYWRAKNVDSSSASSSYSATRSFTVDTDRPDVVSAHRRRRRHHRHGHLVGEPRPDAGRPRQRLLGQRDRRHRDRSATRPRTRRGSRSRARSTTSTRSPSTTPSRAAARSSPTSPLRPATKPRRLARQRLDHQQHRQHRPEHARARLARRRDAAQHGDPDADRDLQRPRPERHRHDHLPGLRRRATARPRSAPSTRPTRRSRTAPTAAAPVPGGTITTDGTYYWRAKNVDSSRASSSYSATRSFIVDTTAADDLSATVAANGITVTVTWSENLDQTQAVAGTAFSVNAHRRHRHRQLPGREQDPVHARVGRQPPRHAQPRLHQAGQRPGGPRPRHPGRQRRERRAQRRLDHQQHRQHRPHHTGLVSPADACG